LVWRQVERWWARVVRIEDMLRVDVHPAHRHSAKAAHEQDPVFPLKDRPVARRQHEGPHRRPRQSDVENLAMQRPDWNRPSNPRFRFPYPRSHGQHYRFASDLASGLLDTDDAIARTNDADQLPHLEPSTKQLDCARSGKAQTVSVDLAVLVKDSAARFDTDSRFEFSAFVAVDPAELEAILVELELLAEDALLLIDDGKGKPGQTV